MSSATLVGLIAVAITVTALIRKNDRGLLLILGIGVMFWAWHYWLIGSVPGGITHSIAAVGIFVAHAVQDKTLKLRSWIATVFITLGVSACVVWGSGWADVFAAAGCIVLTLSQFVWKGRSMRRGFLLGEAIYFFFALSIGSYPGMLVTSSNVAAGLIGLWRSADKKELPANAAHRQESLA